MQPRRYVHYVDMAASAPQAERAEDIMERVQQRLRASVEQFAAARARERAEEDAALARLLENDAFGAAMRARRAK